jgi:uncharacterized RDD family membrane protein YckC
VPKFDNPYAPPESDLAADRDDALDPDDLVDASGGRRFLNLVIDTIGRVIFNMILSTIVGAAGVRFQGVVESFLFGIFTMLLYYILLEGLFGVTLGKLITGTRVVDIEGRKPSFGAVIGRTLARCVPFEPFSVLGGTRGWHDTWSGTRVVVVRR